MGARDAGWIQIYAENNQEVYDNYVQAFPIAEAVRLPVMICMDGFITSHAVENIELLEDAEEISREMGLTIANDVHKLKQHTAEHADPTRQAVKERLQRIAYGELGKGHQDIKDFLTALRQLGVKIDPMKNKQDRIYGLRFEYAGQTFKASEIGREFGYRSLLNQFGITAYEQKGIRSWYLWW